MPQWGRILLGGIGCFLLAWAGLGKVGSAIPLWLPDALLIVLVLDQSGRALAAGLILPEALTRLTRPTRK